jgi:pimeloyl-ACP methyl ester carboxylesterase
MYDVGHFPWLDRPDDFWRIITDFVAGASAGQTR